MKSFSTLCISIFTLSVLITSCKKEKKEVIEKPVPVLWENNEETEELAIQKEHENPRMQFKLLQSKFTDKNDIYADLYWEVTNFSEERYKELSPFILEKNIPSIQKEIEKGTFTYKELTLFYLKRIYKYELNPETTLHTIIALNPRVLDEAVERDNNNESKVHPIYGMPILLKDNINTSNMPTTAGAVVLQENNPTENAFIVSQLESKGALILGKVNLSEWAYYFCSGCPLGYSAIGGQTLNPYGRKIFETGGSSAGSGTAVAANYAVAAIGTETSGSIISPTSQNSLVGLKPTIGVVSRTGIVPISHSLDTAGPMAKNTIDAAIVLDAISGKDEIDTATISKDHDYVSSIKNSTLKGKRLGALNNLLEDSLYAETIKILENQGAEIIKYDPPQLQLNGFLTLLNIEMREDLPKYLANYTSENISVKNLSEVMAFNQKDSLLNMPYNQALFDGIMVDSTSSEDFVKLRDELMQKGNQFFQEPMEKHQLDAVISINNYHSGYAAVGRRPCLALPMGYKENGEPIAITFIGASNSEALLIQLGAAYEKANPVRKIPQQFSK
ncbi:amidase family protein [Patiriisocius hiemis]|uniref:Amidase family protein n=1 Tax=Patiriisocius hiemis TaxID=3075604 RepID=A0ABU2YFI1_9FLAO|nr:amidase family protein [Constantimarinum sp. W242]MDT0556944.1 amidase family protein [Constantimarinum sp. W242]